MRRLFLMGLLLVLASCQDATAPRTDLDALAVQVRVTPQTVVAGSEATVTLTLTNRTGRSLSVASCPMYFWVQTGGEVVSGSRSGACLTIGLPPLIFGPHETKNIPFSWPAVYTEAMLPGTYKVFGWISDARHASLPVSVTVLAARNQ